MSLAAMLQQLRERKLARWLVGYAAGAWVLLQVLGLLAGTYGWPPAAMRIAVAVAVVGFFLALVLAWYHGERGVQRATRLESLLLLFIVAAGGAAIWHSERGRAGQATPSPATATSAPAAAKPAAAKPGALKSIAVLPFVNMSTDPENEFFSDGLSEEILNSLARIDGMQVVGRTSSFQFKGKNEDLRKVGETLGVDTVLEGSVRRSGERARITAQLIRTADGIHLWSETYDRTLDDTLAVQLDIAEKVAGALDVLLDDTQRSRMRKAGIRNVDAFIAYQKGLKLYADAHGKAGVNLLDGLRAANVEFDRATELEPGFFEAHYAKADLFEHTLQHDDLAPGVRADAQRGALRVLQDAAANGRDEQQRLLALAEGQMLSDDWHGLRERIDAAMKAPGCTYSNWLPVFASAFGSGDELEDQGARASICDPLNGINYNTRVSVALATGHPQRALDVEAAYARALPRTGGMRTPRALALAMQGKPAEAARALAAVEPTARPDTYALVRVIVGRANGDSPATIHAAIAGLRRKQGKFDQWRLVDLVEAANAGDRSAANRLAAAMDARPAGPFLLAVASQSCQCGAPFDLDATPNFKARLAESGLRWPPPTTIAYPPRAKDAATAPAPVATAPPATASAH